MYRSVSKKYHQLEKARIDLTNLLIGQPAEKLVASPAPGKWSSLQVINHLFLSETLALKYMKYKWNDRQSLGKAGLRESAKLTLLKITLASPLKYKAPSQAAEFPEVPDRSLLKEWDLERKRLAEFLENFDEDSLRIRIFKHPYIGRISILQTLDFFHAHFIHHKKQILRQLI